MNDKLDVSVSTEDKLFGSSRYRLAIKIMNIHSDEITDLNVEPVSVPGKLIFEARQLELSRLEAQKRLLIREMERQVARAFEIRKIAQMSKISAFFYGMRSFIFEKEQSAMPPWTTEAMKIREWADVEQLEKEFISPVSAESLLSWAFSTNKNKLKDVLEQMKVAGLQTHLGITLLPGNSMVFVFTIKAPHLFRPRTFDAQFKISSKDPQHSQISLVTKSEKLNFHASPFSIPFGAALGAVTGYVVRLALIPGEVPGGQFSWLHLFGSILLGVIAGFFTARSPESRKGITVEDVLGGFIIGAISGLFTAKILAKIEGLLK
jgi:hypothetical protein